MMGIFLTTWSESLQIVDEPGFITEVVNNNPINEVKLWTTVVHSLHFVLYMLKNR